ncbi:MAG: hypothetical protein CTY18_03400 [Methylomonas sp.]|nr:MAG: hypothetical protein CTY24_07125 [Methylobacter sp.]PPD36842.1 MAG: hypothetical protein CTY18_03400 [Methylomonas sp.]
MNRTRHDSSLSDQPPSEYYISRKYRQRSSKRKTIVYLSLALGLETLVLLFAIIALAANQNKQEELQQANAELTAQLAQTQPALENLKSELNALIQAKLPNLIKLELDKVIPIEKNGVKNVNFTVTGTSIKKQYEYKLTFENRGLTPIFPMVDIVLFNRSGIQVGIAQVGINERGERTSLAIDKGETRSYSAAIHFNQEDSEPEYFLIRAPLNGHL